jgi:2-iminobutanoate/2-iminopropanoate deaminase
MWNRGQALVTRRQVVEVEGLGHGAQPIPLAVRMGPLLTTGGISGVDRASGEIPADADAEVANLFANVAAVLEAAGADASAVAKMTFFVRDRSLRDAINQQWVAMFPEAADRPARHTLVHDLPGRMQVQAEVLAFISDAEASA